MLTGASRPKALCIPSAPAAVPKTRHRLNRSLAFVLLELVKNHQIACNALPLAGKALHIQVHGERNAGTF